jgi:hypothetical protein
MNCSQRTGLLELKGRKKEREMGGECNKFWSKRILLYRLQLPPCRSVFTTIVNVILGYEVRHICEYTIKGPKFRTEMYIAVCISLPRQQNLG